PLILQGGTVYVYKGEDIDPALAIVGNAFYNYNTGTWSSQFINDVVVASDFQELLTSPGTWSGGSGGGPGTSSSSNPDFTITGGEMTFGYLMVNTGGSPRTNKTVMRNAAISVEYTSIPAALPFAITDISTNLAISEVTLTWTSPSVGPFDIFASPDLQSLGTQVATGVTSPETVLLPPPLSTAPAVFFRVAE
ncbi:MAG: hypothetical protein GY720_24185, partial [bacterium]|nr:hypothetical protein [bacterium]